MESYASRVRRLSLILFVLIGIINTAFAQSENDKPSKRYGHVNIGFSVNESVIFTDSVTGLGYDFGAGANLEYELFFSDKLSVFGGVGINYLKSSTSSKNKTISLLAADFRLAPKYSLNGKFHLIAGPTFVYSINANLKTSYMGESWDKIDYIPEMQFGAFGGFELYLSDWSALRALGVFRSSSASYEIALIITPKLVGK